MDDSINGYLVQIDETLRAVLSGLSMSVGEVKETLGANQGTSKASDEAWKKYLSGVSTNNEALNEVLSGISVDVDGVITAIDSSTGEAMTSGQALRAILSALSDSVDGGLSELKVSIEGAGEAYLELGDVMRVIAVQMKDEQLEKFDELKSDIIRTADELEQGYKAYTDSTENSIISAVESDFVAKSEYGDYTSATNATLGVYDGRITANTSDLERIDSDYRDYKIEASSQIGMLPSSIMTEVSENFISKDELEGESLETYVGSKITQTKSDITEEFITRLEAAFSDVEGVHGDIEEYITETNAYIRRGELESGVYGIEIGRSDSHIKTRFLNDRVSFYQGEVEVAYISDNNLYITRAEVLDYLRIGNSEDGYFIFDVSPNGLEVRWSE